MNLDNLSGEGLLLLHKAVKQALQSDDEANDSRKPYGVRENSDWRTWADNIEVILRKRNSQFNAINW